MCAHANFEILNLVNECTLYKQIYSNIDFVFFFLSDRELRMESTNPDRFNRGLAILKENNEIDIYFSDEYEHSSDDIEYVPENVMQTDDTETDSFRQLRDQFNSYIDCACECVVEPGRDGSLCGVDSSACRHGRNYRQSQSELVLNPDRVSKDLIYECSEQCACPSNCDNRLVQFGPRRGLQIVDMTQSNKGFGLTTRDRIPAGAFICEYAGEILTRNEALRRHAENDATQTDNYIICLNERSTENEETHDVPMQTFIDPSRRGNIGRYLNHSCDPNCEILSVRIDGSIPKLG